MHKLFLLVLFSAVLIFPQNKYYIFFKDKGLNSSGSLNKNSAAYTAALASLSPKAIERRQKVMKDDIITFEDLPLEESYISELKSLGVKTINELKWFNAVTAYLTAEQIAEINKLPFIKEITPVRKFTFKEDRVSNKESLNKSSDLTYGLSYMQLTISEIPQVHSLGINGRGVLIGILDTGFDWSRHVSLKNALVLGERDFVQGDSITANQPGDDPSQDGHGTGVFSIIGGYKDSTLIGAAYGASFLLAKTENESSETHVEEDNYAAALEWMEGRGVDITTSSLGYNIFDTGTSYRYSDMDGKTTIVTRAAKLAFERGVVTVSAAGNEGNSSWRYIIAPADENYIISVGAVYSNRQVTEFSSRGPTYDGRIKPEVCAMGAGVHFAISQTTDVFGFGNGTSFATPIVSGIAALILSEYPFLDNMQVRNIIINSGDNYKTPDNNMGYGIASAKRALELPNVQRVNGTVILHKMFFNNSINRQSVKVTVASPQDTVILPMSADGNSYTVTLPSQSLSTKLTLYFTYSDSSGSNFREPAAASSGFTYYYGDYKVSPSDITAEPPYDYGILSQNYPNPFNNITTIKFNIRQSDVVQLYIYNSLGQKVGEYFPESSFTGEHSFIWNGTSMNNVRLPSGVYVYQLFVNGSIFTKKMIYLK